MKVTYELLQTNKPAYQNNGQAELAPVSSLTNAYLVLLGVTDQIAVLYVSATFTGINEDDKGLCVRTVYSSY